MTQLTYGNLVVIYFLAIFLNACNINMNLWINCINSPMAQSIKVLSILTDNHDSSGIHLFDPLK
jgi:hypothetical protein